MFKDLIALIFRCGSEYIEDGYEFSVCAILNRRTQNPEPKIRLTISKWDCYAGTIFEEDDIQKFRDNEDLMVSKLGDIIDRLEIKKIFK